MSRTILLANACRVLFRRERVRNLAKIALSGSASVVLHRSYLHGRLTRKYGSRRGPWYVIQRILAEVAMRYAKRDTSRNNSEELQEAYDGHSNVLYPRLYNHTCQTSIAHAYIRENMERTGRRVYFLRHFGFDVA